MLIAVLGFRKEKEKQNDWCVGCNRGPYNLQSDIGLSHGKNLFLVSFSFAIIWGSLCCIHFFVHTSSISENVRKFEKNTVVPAQFESAYFEAKLARNSENAFCLQKCMLRRSAKLEGISWKTRFELSGDLETDRKMSSICHAVGLRVFRKTTYQSLLSSPRRPSIFPDHTVLKIQSSHVSQTSNR